MHNIKKKKEVGIGYKQYVSEYKIKALGTKYANNGIK